MKTFSKKELNKEVSKKIEEIFSKHNKGAAAKIKKQLNASMKLLVKKFTKAVKKTAKKKKPQAKTGVKNKKSTTVKKKR